MNDADERRVSGVLLDVWRQVLGKRACRAHVHAVQALVRAQVLPVHGRHAARSPHSLHTRLLVHHHQLARVRCRRCHHSHATAASRFAKPKTTTTTIIVVDKQQQQHDWSEQATSDVRAQQAAQQAAQRDTLVHRAGRQARAASHLHRVHQPSGVELDINNLYIQIQQKLKICYLQIPLSLGNKPMGL